MSGEQRQVSAVETQAAEAVKAPHTKPSALMQGWYTRTPQPLINGQWKGRVRHDINYRSIILRFGVPLRQRKLTEFSLGVIFQFRLQGSCKTVTMITKQSSAVSTTREFSYGRIEAPIRL